MKSRLEAFEEMLSEVLQKYSETSEKLEKLKAEGKTKTASFRELLGEKLTCRYMISLYEKHGLIQKNNFKER
ncbi:MAG: hypothetical protein J6K92_11485 [Oscillospiraceae bacterium]|nr:hypothetical protein [Oscillospiraceae bacterium]